MGKRLFLSLFCCILTFLYSATSWAFVDYIKLYSFNSWASARGGTNIAIGGDPSGAELNPAIIGGTKDNAFDVNLTLIFPDFHFKYTGTGGQQYTSRDERRLLFAPNMTFAHKVKSSRWSWGLSLAAPDALITSYNVKSKYYGPVTGDSFVLHMRFGPVFSYQITPKLSVGVRLDATYGVLHVKMPLGRAFLDTNWLGGFGMSYSVGFLYKPTENLSIGAYYESQTLFQDIKTRHHDGSLKMVMPSGELRFPQLRVKAEDFKFPENWGIGIAYRPIPSLRLSADMRHIHWSEYWDKLKLKFGGFGAREMRNLGLPTNLRLPLRVRDETSYSVGAEYFFKERYKVAIGYHFHDDAMKENYFTPFIPAELKHTISCGFSAIFGKLKVGFTYMYSILDRPKSKEIHGFERSLESQLGLPPGFLDSEHNLARGDYRRCYSAQLTVGFRW